MLLLCHGEQALPAEEHEQTAEKRFAELVDKLPKSLERCIARDIKREEEGGSWQWSVYKASLPVARRTAVTEAKITVLLEQKGVLVSSPDKREHSFETLFSFYLRFDEDSWTIVRRETPDGDQQTSPRTADMVYEIDVLGKKK